jgi:sugar lactone lactonase YvrE
MHLTIPAMLTGLISSSTLSTSYVVARSPSSNVRQLLELPGMFMENIAIRSNGHILLNTISQGQMYSVDPSRPVPEARLVAQLEGVNTLTGIAEIARDLFAITGSIWSLNTGFEPGSLKVALVDFQNCNEESGEELPSVNVISEGTDITLLNGMTKLPRHSHILLSAASATGEIWRVNTATKLLEVAFQDVELTPDPVGLYPAGVNGVEILNGYLYYTNTGRGTFGRVKIDEFGNKAGDVQVVARLPGGPASAPDDFALGRDGTAFVAIWPNFLVKISPGGEQTVLVNNTIINPTSVALQRDAEILYVVTAGQETEPVVGGQLVEVRL